MSTVESGTPRPTKKRRFTPLELPPCLICGGKGSGIHFGVNTCMGCKAFFQRCLKREQPYTCSKSGACQIVDSFRGNCSACRLQKCIAMGMSREGIRMGRYTSMERAIKITEVKNLQGSTNVTTDDQRAGNSPENEMSHVHRHCNGQVISITSKDIEQSKKNKTDLVHNQNVVDATQNSVVDKERVADVHQVDTVGRKTNSKKTSDYVNFMKNTLRKKIDEYEQKKLHRVPTHETNGIIDSIQDVSNEKQSSFYIDVDAQPLSDVQSLSEIIDSYSNGITEADDLLTFDFLEDILSLDQFDRESQVESLHVQENTLATKRQCLDLNKDLDNKSDTSSASNSSSLSLNDLMEDETVQGIIGYYNVFVTAPNLSREEINAKLRNAYEEYQLQTSLFGPMKALSLEEYKEVRRETGLDIDGRMALMTKAKQMEEMFFDEYVDFAHAIPGFIDLPFDDQYGLLMSSVWDVNVIRTERGTDDTLEMVLLDTGDILHLDQTCLFQTREITKRFFDMHKHIHQLQLDNTELALTAAISIMFRDRCKLQRSNDVEQIQTNLVRVLRKILYRRLQSKDEARKKFVKIIDIFVKLRELSHLTLQNMKALCKDELIQEVHPNCDVMFEDDSIFAWV
ncbi:hypothetical protein FSP39_024515 [Pinctada imbricata]|uniref:Uncharacterized protein n=1 Tax=Pinctada imbricata TaxID=66713 RepID=A0AA89BXL9_PINIB|nr:hypothetical protein FSP39_024515 [Pinctada imbricata]